MKAVLNVDGKKLEVTNISYESGKVVVVTVWDDKIITPYYDANCAWIPVGAKVLYLNELLEYPSIEQAVSDKWKKLIEHLEEVEAEEREWLTHIAIKAMTANSLPFTELSLLEKQKEYKLREQRVLGVEDTVKEVKAIAEGWYADDDTTTANETKVANQTT